MKNRILSLLTWLALSTAAFAQSSILTINTSTGLVNIPAGSATPNFAALKVGSVTITLPAGAIVGTSDTQDLTGKTYNGITATSSTNTFTLTVGTASITLPAGVSGSIGSAAFLTPSANVITLLGSPDFAAFRSNLNVPTLSILTADYAVPADFEVHTVPNGVAVAAGTYYIRMRCVVKWDTGTDVISVTVGSPTVTAGSVVATAIPASGTGSTSAQPAVALSSVDLGLGGTDSPVEFKVEGWATFSGAGTVSFVVNSLDATVTVVAAATIQIVPFTP